MMKIYLAHRYAGTEEEREERFQNASRVAGLLMKEGYIVFSPISHSHPIAATNDHGFWMKQDLPLIKWCDEMWIVDAFAWWESKGINHEMDYAHEIGKPIRIIRR